MEGGTEQQPEKLAPGEWAWVGAAAILCGLLRLLFAARRGFWLDEYYTFQATQAPVADMIPERFSAGHSPLYFLYARLFADGFGTSETALRASSALAAALAVVAVAGLAARLGLRRLLKPLLFLAIFHPYWQVIGTEFRYMMPLACLGAFWSWAVVACTQDRSRRAAIAVMVCGSVALWVHGSAQFILGALAIYVLLDLRARTERGAVRPADSLASFLPLVGAFGLSLPLILGLRMMPKVAAEATPDIPSVRKAITNQVHTYFGDDLVFSSVTGLNDNWFSTVFLVIFIAAVIVVVRFHRRQDTPKPAGRYLAATLIGLPLVVMLITAVGKDVEGPARYVAFLSVPMLLMIALLWHEAGAWGGRGIAMRALMVVAIGSSWTLQALDQGEWHRETIHWLAEHRRADQPIVTAGRAVNQLALRYHGLKPAGELAGISSDQSELAVPLNLLREKLQRSDSMFFLLYHEGDVPVGDAIAKLRAEGTIRSVRVWQPTGNVVLLGLARTEKGAADLAALPPIDPPRLTHSPLRAKDRKAARWKLE